MPVSIYQTIYPFLVKSLNTNGDQLSTIKCEDLFDFFQQNSGYQNRKLLLLSNYLEWVKDKIPVPYDISVGYNLSKCTIGYNCCVDRFTHDGFDIYVHPMSPMCDQERLLMVFNTLYEN